MSYLVLARKCRPGRFDEVVGQAHVTQTLANAIKMDRVAHGFLFSGVRGVGKTSLVRILAKSLNCKEGPTDNPCGVCESCRTIAEGTAVDVIEIDGASNNSVEDIRELRETVPYRPIIGRFKIYAIDEVHMLSVSAFNALLKTLEEPPPHVKFIFATTEPHKIPNTILSRVQRYDFRRIPTVSIIERISQILAEEDITFDDGALAIVGREADGSMRDALSLLDQVLASGEKHVDANQVAALLGVVGRATYFELSAAIIDHQPGRCLEIIVNVDKQGFDIPTFCRGFLEHLRNLVAAAVCGENTQFLELPREELTRLQEQVGRTTRQTLHRMLKHMSEAYEEISRSPFPRILTEAVVARLADMGEVVPMNALLARLEKAGGALGDARRGADATAGPSTHKTAPPSTKARGAQPHNEVRPSGGDNSGPETNNVVATPNDAPPRRNDTANQTALSKSDWERLVGQLSKRMPAKASMLERAVVASESTQSEITLHVDRSDSFTAAQLQTPAMMAEFTKTLGEMLGHQVRLNIKVLELEDSATLAKKKLMKQEAARQKQENARNHPVVKGFVSTLGGTITTVRFDK